MNDVFCNFYDVIDAVVKDNVPSVNIRDRKYPHWYDRDIICMIKEKYRWRKKYIDTGRDNNSPEYKKFSNLRSEVKKYQKVLYKDYLERIATDIKENSKRFWSFAKSKRSSSTIPKQIT